MPGLSSRGRIGIVKSRYADHDNDQVVKVGLVYLQPSVLVVTYYRHHDREPWNCLWMIRDDGIVMIGEIGGNLEAEAAHWYKQHSNKPVVGLSQARQL